MKYLKITLLLLVFNCFSTFGQTNISSDKIKLKNSLKSKLTDSRNDYEKELIANWNNYPLGYRNDITFMQDSIITFNNFEKEIGNWKADSSKIYISFYNKSKYYQLKEVVLNYRLSKNKDTLHIKDALNEINLLKVKNYWEHYLKEIDLKINLPKPDFKTTKIDSDKKGFDIYIGFKNNKVEIKTESTYQKYNILEKLDNHLMDKIYSHYNLIIDEKVPQKNIDSVKQVLSIYPKMKFFRVYKNDSENYGKYNFSNSKNDRKDWKWYGKYE
jgi:hypothetical protein